MLSACGWCGKDFGSKASGARYCSHACYVEKSRQNAADGLIARFWAKVHQTDGCWLWMGARGDRFGHGAFSYRSEPSGPQHHVYAHRFAWTITHGPILDNLCVLHRCDVPACVNPDHLFLGTQPDNLLDARQKGRLVPGRHLIKVSDAGIADIQRRYVPRHNGKQLAAEYGITLVSVLRIVNGTQRQPKAPQPVLERVPHVLLPVRGDLHVS